MPPPFTQGRLKTLKMLRYSIGCRSILLYHATISYSLSLLLCHSANYIDTFFIYYISTKINRVNVSKYTNKKSIGEGYRVRVVNVVVVVDCRHVRFSVIRRRIAVNHFKFIIKLIFIVKAHALGNFIYS